MNAKGGIAMALPDSEINTVLDQFNQRRLEDPEFARLAQEDPISAFDSMARSREAHLAAKGEGFPLPLPGRKLTLEQLALARCGG